MLISGCIDEECGVCPETCATLCSVLALVQRQSEVGIKVNELAMLPTGDMRTGFDICEGVHTDHSPVLPDANPPVYSFLDVDRQGTQL